MFAVITDMMKTRTIFKEQLRLKLCKNLRTTRLGQNLLVLKVTVQFEAEENGQNEIVSHMDRSEVKL